MGQLTGKVAKRHVNFVKCADASAGRGNADDEIVHPNNRLFTEDPCPSAEDVVSYPL